MAPCVSSVGYRKKAHSKTKASEAQKEAYCLVLSQALSQAEAEESGQAGAASPIQAPAFAAESEYDGGCV